MIIVFLYIVVYASGTFNCTACWETIRGTVTGVLKLLGQNCAEKKNHYLLIILLTQNATTSVRGRYVKQVAFTYVHAYMQGPVPQGSQ